MNTPERQDDIVSPVLVSVSTKDRLREGHHVALDVELRNDAERALGVEVTLSSRVLPKIHVKKALREDERWTWQPDEFLLPTAEQGTGSRGSVRFTLELVLDGGDEGRHRFQGKFSLNVAPGAADSGPVNLTIENHGKNASMGAIYDIHVPTSAGDEATPPGVFERVALVYVGPEAAGPRPGAPLRRATLSSPQGRLLVHGQESLTLGRAREKADVVAWVFPRGRGQRRADVEDLGPAVPPSGGPGRRVRRTPLPEQLHATGGSTGGRAAAIAGRRVHARAAGRVRSHPHPAALGPPRLPPAPPRRRCSDASASGAGCCGGMTACEDEELVLWLPGAVAVSALPGLAVSGVLASAPDGLRWTASGDEVSLREGDVPAPGVQVTAFAQSLS